MFDQQQISNLNNCVEKKYPVYRKCLLLFDYLAILLQSSKDLSNYNTNNLKLLEMFITVSIINEE